MNKIIASVAGAACFFATSAGAIEVGKPAPDFSLPSAAGKDVSLSDYQGKIVVLEWSNPGCPFVKKFYAPGAMQKFQKAATDKGVVWLTINSSASGKEGHLTAETARQFIADKKAAPTAYLLDGEGKVGKLYGAKTTPHMFVIDKSGALAYAGAIDSKATASSGDIESAKNYVNEAITALLAGKEVETKTSQAYGCSVKY